MIGRRDKNLAPGLMLLGGLAVILCCQSGGAGTAAAAEPLTKPVLRIETRAEHAAIILGLAVSADGSRVATASHDRTVRFWSMPELELVRTVHLPVGEGVEGVAGTGDFSPDGKVFITTGWIGDWDKEQGKLCFYVIDVKLGDIIRVICDLPRAANHIAFSADGKYVGMALKAGAGVRVYRASDYSVAYEDRNYGDSSTWVEFDSSGRMVTSSLDGKIRLYEGDSQGFRLIEGRAMPEGRKPDGLSISPDGTRIAVGYMEPEGDDPLWRPAIDIVSVSASGFTMMPRPDLSGIDNGALWRVAWSRDGSVLYAGGTWRKGSRYYVRRWINGGQGRPLDIPAAPNRLLRMRALSPAGLIFTSELPYIGVIGANDRLVAERRTVIADYTDIGDKLAVSRDGYTVRFAFEPSSEKPAYFSVSQRLLREGDVPPGTEMFSAVVESTALDVRDWAGSFRPTLNGKPLPMTRQHERTLSLAFANKEKTFLLGTHWNVIRYNSNGEIVWAKPIPYGARGVVVTPDDRMVVVAIGDGTVRWLALDDGRELLAFFPHRDGERWVAWTSSGYYMASVGGDRLIGWQVNRGRDHAADFFPASVFRELYYRPDIVTKVLATLNEKTAIKRADEESGRPPHDRALASLLPPVVSILRPESGTAVASPRVSVQYEFRAASGEAIKSVEVRANGRPLATIERGSDAPLPERGGIEVYVPRRDVELEVVVQTESGIWSTPATAGLRWTGPKIEENPALYVLAIGVSRYKSKALSLQYADKDADDFVKLLRAQEGRRYRQVNVEPLENEDAQIPKIREALRWLETNTTSRDVAMLFIAGHGTEDPAGQYFFLPYEASPADVFERGLSYGELRAALARIPGKVFLFIDTCRSGAIGNTLAQSDMARIANDLRNSEYGVVVFASSTGSQDSMESAEWQNGAFTKALIAGLSGKAPQNDGYVTALGLSYFLSGEVLRLTNERQRPVFGQPVSADFSLVKVAK